MPRLSQYVRQEDSSVATEAGDRRHVQVGQQEHELGSSSGRREAQVRKSIKSSIADAEECARLNHGPPQPLQALSAPLARQAAKLKDAFDRRWGPLRRETP